MKDDIVCVYHEDCVDGTTAAAVVLKKFPHARAFPLGHGHTDEELEGILEQTTQDTYIYIVDSVLGLEALTTRGNEITVLDHHVSVHEETKAYAENHQNVTYYFDNTKSGASLAWSYFFPEEPVPWLVKHVEDEDLWIHKLGEDTEHIVNYLSLHRNNPTFVKELIDTPVAALVSRGRQISEYIRAEIDHEITREPVYARINGHRIPLFNITTNKSACGNILSTQVGSVVGMFTISGDSVRISFRSLEEHTPSAQEIAEHLGGGGHRNASGGGMSLSDFITVIEH